jgi:hypothetical protein
MSNKKETPVSWFAMITKELGYVSEAQLNHALEMESKKQQKYNEMLGMLEKLVYEEDFVGSQAIKQLIKEAKEL